MSLRGLSESDEHDGCDKGGSTIVYHHHHHLHHPSLPQLLTLGDVRIDVQQQQQQQQQHKQQHMMQLQLRDLDNDDNEEQEQKPKVFATRSAAAAAALRRFRKRASLYQKLGAEVIATFVLVFSGAGAAMLGSNSKSSSSNKEGGGGLSPLGVSAANGLVVMMMIYATGHISGAHMNPAVTFAFATVRHFPWPQVPLYVGAQLTGSLSASFVLRHLLLLPIAAMETLPAGSVLQSFVLELLISFVLMFVVAAVSTDTRAVGELAGLAVGATVTLNNIIAGPISGASMNPARSIGPAVATNNFTSIWLYIVSPMVGTLGGAWAYNLIRTADSGRDMSASSRRRSFNKRDLELA